MGVRHWIRNHKKSIAVSAGILFCGGILLAVYLLFPYFVLGRRALQAKNLLSDCDYEIQYHIRHIDFSGREDGLLKLLDTAGLDIMSGRIYGEKRQNIIHLCYGLEGIQQDTAEFYGELEEKEIFLNLSTLYAFFRQVLQDSSPSLDFLPERKEDYYISLNDLAEVSGIVIDTETGSEMVSVYENGAWDFRTCKKPEDSGFEKEIADMYFFRLEVGETVCLLGIPQKQEGDDLTCYLRYSIPELELETLVSCRKAQGEGGLEMPEKALTQQQMEYLKRLGQFVLDIRGRLKESQ